MNCKQGDLAIVVGNIITPGLLNRFVIVDRKPYDGEEFVGVKYLNEYRGSGAGLWVVKSAVEGESLPWQGNDGTVDQFAERILPDANLRPIDPDDPAYVTAMDARFQLAA